MKKNTSKEIINSFFDEKYEQYGKDVRSLGWSEESQRVRFDFFSNLTNLDNKAVLDVGSGFGGFSLYCKDIYPNMKYLGYDINKNFIEKSEESGNIKFEQRDVLENPPDIKFDVIFSIGALNVYTGDNLEMMKKFMKILFDSCNQVLAISMTSIYVDSNHRNDTTYFYDPCEIFSYAKTLTRDVVLYHNYLPHDFTIVLNKEKNEINL